VYLPEASSLETLGSWIKCPAEYFTSPCTQEVLASRTECFCNQESGISARHGSAHKVRCLGEPADRNKKEAAEKLEGLNVLFSLFLTDGINLLLEEITARMSHGQREGNGSPLRL